MRERYESNGVRIVKKILVVLIIILLVFVVHKFVANSDMIGIFVSESPINIESLNEINAEDIEKASLQGEAYHYYYNQLDDNAKIFYKSMENNIENMKSGTYEIDFGTYFNDLLNTPNGEEELNKAFQSAWNALSYDHVEIFYIDVTKLVLNIQTTSIGSMSKHTVYINNGKNTSYLSEELNGETVEEAETEIQIQKNEIVEKIQYYNDIDKIIYLHDWMIDNFEYDVTYEEDNIYNIYGALKNKKTVCEGYARTFKYILDDLGIPCVLISGDATNSNGETEAHAWDYVKIDGKWYAMDITWDDPIVPPSGLTNEMRYEYLLRGSEVFLKNHIEDGEISENSMKFVYPTLDRYDYNI